ncbi:hypothetical protein AVEN_67331-1, partial [Araneus ventricosus]
MAQGLTSVSGVKSSKSGSLGIRCRTVHENWIGGICYVETYSPPSVCFDSTYNGGVETYKVSE